ncbi:MAG: M28 family peptidase [Mucilaginibacter polytrichastri]|nr:M28 family peptidase [Mucilaginibacter polytrichastri]
MIRSLGAGLFALGIALSACAQQDKAAMKYAKFITPEDARKHLSILASDEFEGRETGKPGAMKAADYIAAEFKRLGLKPPVNGSYFQDIPMVEAIANIQKFTVDNQPFTFGEEFYLSGNPSPAKLNFSEVLFVGYGISDAQWDELKDLDLKGKAIVVINDGEPMKDGKSLVTGTSEASAWSITRNKRVAALADKGPALILAYSPRTAQVLKSYKEYFTQPQTMLKSALDKGAGKPQTLNIDAKLADALVKASGKTITQLKSAIDSAGKPLSVSLKSQIVYESAPKITPVKAVNVLGYMEGKDKTLKNELLLLTAHYDHVGVLPETAENKNSDRINNGADDDGSGTTGVLEMATAFSKAKAAGKGPRRSILFMTVVGEEKGLLGSEYYSENPVFPLENTITDLNTDMIGRIDPDHEADSNYVYLIGSNKLSTDLHKISEQANSTYTKLNLDYKYNDPADPNRFYYRSDHYNFAKHNIPIIFYFNGVHADYHKPSDEVSKITFPMLAKRAQLIFYTAWDLANREKRPVVDVKNDMPEDR